LSYKGEKDGRRTWTRTTIRQLMRLPGFSTFLQERV